MARHVLGTLAEFPPGSRRRIEVGRRAVAVFNAGGRLYALRDVCPHQGAPLSAGVVLGEVSSDGPGEYRYNPDCRLVRCPWHGWEYNLETGQSSYDPEHDRVRAYPIGVESGAELVAAGASQGPAGATPAALARDEASDAPPGRRDGPYTVETFEVSIQDDYVVLDM